MNSPLQNFISVALPIMVTLIATIWISSWSQKKRFEDWIARFEDLRRDMNRRFDESKIEMERRFTELEQRFTEVDRRFSHMNRRFDKVDDRLERIEFKLETVTNKESFASKNGPPLSTADLLRIC
jgi:biopolymer transport protein ExbB/TolQ